MEKKKLVNLSGTIPVAYEGLMYNIPVCIWLHETHPQNPPKCLVRPSVSMVINTNSSFVDAAGLVFLRCLRNWVPGRCNLSVVIEEMRAAFQRETPLFTVTPFSPAAASAAPHPECPPQTGSGAAQQFLDPHRQYCPDAGPAYPASASPQRRAVPSPGPAPLSPAKTGPANTDGRQDGQPGTAGPSGTRKSYTEELLDLGITFGEERGHSPSPLNPFLQDTPAANTSPSNLEDVNNLFKSLQLDNVANMYQLNPGNRGGPGPSPRPEKKGPVPEGQGLVDDRHEIEVNRLPLGLPPHRMRNKLTIYFQRLQNGGGEVLDVTYPAGRPDQACVMFCDHRDAEQVLKQTDRIFTVNKQDFPIQVKKVDRKPMPLPAGIPRDKADMFRSLLSLERRFAPEEVLEAVLSCRDLPSALRFLSHECPICREQVSFGKIITMTHCSCAFCESCFKAYFSSVIKEKSIVAVACPICNKPDVRATARWEEAMDFFSLLDTQIRHYLDEETHELFQRKLRDHALQEMPNFRWCAHCSFGLLHEADRLRMDCPSCGKSTCSKCRGPVSLTHTHTHTHTHIDMHTLFSPQNNRMTPRRNELKQGHFLLHQCKEQDKDARVCVCARSFQWVPQHEGLTCEKFKEWQLHNNPEYQTARLEQLLSRNKIGRCAAPLAGRTAAPRVCVRARQRVTATCFSTCPFRLSQVQVPVLPVQGGLSALQVHPVSARVLWRLQQAVPAGPRLQFLCRVQDQRSACPPPPGLSVPPAGLECPPTAAAAPVPSGVLHTAAPWQRPGAAEGAHRCVSRPGAQRVLQPEGGVLWESSPPRVWRLLHAALQRVPSGANQQEPLGSGGAVQPGGDGGRASALEDCRSEGLSTGARGGLLAAAETGREAAAQAAGKPRVCREGRVSSLALHTRPGGAVEHSTKQPGEGGVPQLPDSAAAQRLRSPRNKGLLRSLLVHLLGL
uniref:E3 ubiquitin-protein ligase RNF31-like n=1 Tax=Scleropages formosus TaxID=113540 RepID=A0A8C9VZN4_SCLFO